MSIGEPVARLDGPAKVTGAARYAADQYADGQLYAVFVGARIPAGAVQRVDSGQAAREPGVVRVLAATDMPAVHPGFADVGCPPLATRFLPMQGEEIRYAGQPVALVLADWLEAAEAGAELVKVTYRPTPFVVPDTAPAAPPSPDSGYAGMGDVTFRKGDAEAELARCPFRAGGEYVQPSRHNNPMEPSAILALWQDDDRLTVYDSVQHLYAVQSILAAAFGIEAADVRVIAPPTPGAASAPRRTSGRTRSSRQWRPR